MVFEDNIDYDAEIFDVSECPQCTDITEHDILKRTYLKQCDKIQI